MSRVAPVLVLILNLAVAATVRAASIPVPCSPSALVDAINTANGNAVDDVIELASGCTYTLSAVDNTDPDYGPNGLPMVMTSNALVIHGNGATLARSDAPGTPDFRVLDVSMAVPGPGGGAPQFMLDHVTIRNGRVADTSQGYTPAGGGLLLQGSEAAGPAVLDDLTLLGNQAYAGGGMAQAYAGLVDLQNSLVTDNIGGLYGGGIAATAGQLVIASSRITNNQQGSPGLLSDPLAYLVSGGGGLASYLCDALTILDSEISGNQAYGLGGGGIGILATPGSMVNARVHDNGISIPDDVNPGFNVEFGGGGGMALGNFSAAGSAPDFTIQRSAIYANTAQGSAGGIGYAGSITSAINNTTVSGNQAGTRGGGIGNAAQLLLLVNATVAANTAPRGAGLDIGTYADPNGNLTTGTAWYINTAIADNAGSSDCYNDGGSVTDNLGSLLEIDAAGANACDGVSGKNFALRADPGLSPWSDHGGPDPSHLPLPDSPLIDAGVSGWNSSPTDQRGDCFLRVRGVGLDIGAIESGNQEVLFCAGFDPSQVLN